MCRIAPTLRIPIHAIKKEQNRPGGEISAGMSLPRHPAQRRKQFMKLVLNVTGQLDTVQGDLFPDFKKVVLSVWPV